MAFLKYKTTQISKYFTLTLDNILMKTDWNFGMQEHLW